LTQHSQERALKELSLAMVAPQILRDTYLPGMEEGIPSEAII
jgi:hypothetical protein